MDNITSKIKPTIENWIELNRNLLKEFSILENGSDIDITVKPKKATASGILISIYGKLSVCDISVGNFTQVCNFDVRKTEDLITILDAVKMGNVRESIFTVLGFRAKVYGTLRMGEKVHEDTGYVMPFNLMVHLIKPKEENIKFDSW